MVSPCLCTPARYISGKGALPVAHFSTVTGGKLFAVSMNKARLEVPQNIRGKH